MSQTVQSKLDSEISNARQTFDLLRMIIRDSERMVESGYFSDSYRIHQFAVYLLESQHRINSLREALRLLRDDEIAVTAEQSELVCN